MLELGQEAKGFHLELGQEAARLGLDYLAAVGSLSGYFLEGAEIGGLSRDRLASFDRPEEAALYLRGKLSPGDALLIKGSRSMGLERAASALMAPADPPSPEQA
jgi:UDP-N-acetylmuramoyl-tripeptide--D-alanyl-D-alanine ligase